MSKQMTRQPEPRKKELPVVQKIRRGEVEFVNKPLGANWYAYHNGHLIGTFLTIDGEWHFWTPNSIPVSILTDLSAWRDVVTAGQPDAGEVTQ